MDRNISQQAKAPNGAGSRLSPLALFRMFRTLRGDARGFVFRARLSAAKVPAMAELSPDEHHRRDCLARHLLSRWHRAAIVEWLNDPKHGEAFREDMRVRLNRLRAQEKQR